MPGSKRDLRKEKHWREVISDWQDSGLSKLQYCREHDLRSSTLSGWVTTIKDRDAEHRRVPTKTSRARRLVNPRRSQSEKRSQTDFVEAKYSSSARQDVLNQPSDKIEIVTPSGLVVRLPTGSNSAFLFAVLQALR